MVCGAVWNAPNPLNPVEDGGLVNRQSAFPPEFFRIALPHGVAPIPSHGTDGVLSPEEFVDVPFVIYLTAQAPFTFVVAVFEDVE
jgi:hypothetical protein